VTARSIPAPGSPRPAPSGPRARAAARRAARPYIPEGSLLRTVQRERTVALSGARALFMQAAHPVAFDGFFSYSAALDNPHPRLARTALAINTVIYGSEAQAREVQQIVGAMHARVRGTMKEGVGRFPAGTPFRGNDPELLHWILAAFIDSSYRSYERYVRRLGDDEREALWQQWRMVGEIFGLEGDAMPRTYAGHVEYVRAMLASGDLVVSDRARELSLRVILNPPIPAALFAVKELVNQVTIDSLPRDLQRQFGFWPLPGRGIAIRNFERWMRLIGTPLAPDVVRHVPGEVMPSPGRNYADLVEFVAEHFGR
jgi:uncharacterized protein (DUF2236 family)